jgi:prepilin peptidase CpaA
MLLEIASPLAVLAMASLLVWAAATDTLTMTIPNRIVLGIVGLYPAWLATQAMLGQGSGVDPLMAGLLAAVVLASGFVAFSYGLIGGGDAKLLSAVTLWAGPDHAAEMIAVIAILGGGLAAVCYLALTVRRRLCLARGEPVEAETRLAKRPISYGVAIALGGLYVALRLLTG